MRHSFELETTIARPVAAVYQHLAQPANWIGLQPLLVAISPARRALEAGQECLYYTTTERFRFLGLLTYDNPIAVRCVLTKPNARIDCFVRSFPRIRLAVAYTFLPCPYGTRLIEQVRIDCAWALLPYVAATAQRVQRQTLANLKARLELPTSTLLPAGVRGAGC